MDFLLEVDLVGYVAGSFLGLHQWICNNPIDAVSRPELPQVKCQSLLNSAVVIQTVHYFNSVLPHV